MSVPTNSLDGLIESFCFILEHFLAKAGVPVWRENEGQSVYNLCPPCGHKFEGYLLILCNFNHVSRKSPEFCGQVCSLQVRFEPGKLPSTPSPIPLEKLIGDIHGLTRIYHLP